MTMLPRELFQRLRQFPESHPLLFDGELAELLKSGLPDKRLNDAVVAEALVRAWLYGERCPESILDALRDRHSALFDEAQRRFGRFRSGVLEMPDPELHGSAELDCAERRILDFVRSDGLIAVVREPDGAEAIPIPFTLESDPGNPGVVWDRTKKHKIEKWTQEISLLRNRLRTPDPSIVLLCDCEGFDGQMGGGSLALAVLLADARESGLIKDYPSLSVLCTGAISGDGLIEAVDGTQAKEVLALKLGVRLFVCPADGNDRSGNTLTLNPGTDVDAAFEKIEQKLSDLGETRIIDYACRRIQELEKRYQKADIAVDLFELRLDGYAHAFESGPSMGQPDQVFDLIRQARDGLDIRDGAGLVRKILDRQDGELNALIPFALSQNANWLAYKADLLSGIAGDKRASEDAVRENEDNDRWTLARTVIALANTCGGAVLLGVDEAGHAVEPQPGDPPSLMGGKNTDAFIREAVDRALHGNRGVWTPLSNGRETRIECDEAETGLCYEIRRATLDEAPVFVILVRPVPADKNLVAVVEDSGGLTEREVVLVRKMGETCDIETLTTGRQRKQWQTTRADQLTSFSDLWERFQSHCSSSSKGVNEKAIAKAINDYHERINKSPLWQEIERSFTQLDAEQLSDASANENGSGEGHKTPRLEPYAIEDIYDPVAAWDPDRAVGKDPGLTDEEEDEENAPPCASLGVPRTARQGTVSELLNTEARCILLGEPGGGKSTCLRFLTLDDLHAYGKAKGKRVSLFVALARFKGDLETLIVNETKIPALILGSLANEGRVRLMLDGLNECPQQLQGICIQQINLRLGMYPDMPVVLTTRRHHFRGQLALPVFTVKPLSAAQQVSFLAAYLKNPALAGEQIKQLYKSSAGRLLASSPLLLRLVAYVVNSGKEIPPGRALLYRMFIEGWCRHELYRIEKSKGKPPWSFEDIRQALGVLAWKTRCKGWTSCKLTWAEEQLTAAGVAEASRLLDTFARGMLYVIDPDNDAFEFLHETFQEYFAAEYVAKEQSMSEGWSMGEDPSRWLMVLAYVLELNAKVAPEILEKLGKCAPLACLFADLSDDELDRLLRSPLWRLEPEGKDAWLWSVLFGDPEKQTFEYPKYDYIKRLGAQSEALAYLTACSPHYSKRWAKVLQALLNHITQPETAYTLINSRLTDAIPETLIKSGERDRSKEVSGVCRSSEEEKTAPLFVRIILEPHLKRWRITAKPDQASSLLKYGLLTKADFEKRTTEWRDTVTPHDATVLVNTEIMTAEDFAPRAAEWRDTVTPHGATVLVNAGIMTPDDFAPRTAEWRDTVTPHDAAVLVNARIMTAEDFAPRLQKWKARANAQEAGALIRGKLLAAADFHAQLTSLRETGTLTAAKKWVTNHVFTWHDFAPCVDRWLLNMPPSFAELLLKQGVLSEEQRADYLQHVKRSASPGMARACVEKGFLVWEDFRLRHKEWARQVDFDAAVLLVEDGVMRSEEFVLRVPEWAAKINDHDWARAIRAGLMTAEAIAWRKQKKVEKNPVW